MLSNYSASSHQRSVITTGYHQGMKNMPQTLKLQIAVGAWMLIAAACVCAQDTYALQGDVGIAAYRTPALTRTTQSGNTVLPYAYADYGPLYARINTLGYKAMPLGAGHLEVSARVTLEGYQSSQAGISERTSPLPVGLGTFQKTAYGAIFAYSFYDPNSGGSLVDLMYAAKFNVAGVNIYPQLGLERRSAKYVQHLYGVSVAEATVSGLSVYTAQSSTTPNLGFTAQYALNDNYSVSYQLRKKWFDTAITNSPLVNVHSQTTSFLALTRTFK
jgi:outer membrane protein